MRTLILLLAALSVFACSDTEDRRLSLVDNPRILAVASTPSIVGPGETAQLEALVVDGNGRVSNAIVEWRACAPWTRVVDPDMQCGPDASLPLVDGAFVAPAEIESTVQVPVVAEVEIDGIRVVAVKQLRIVSEVPETVPSLGLTGFHLDGDLAPTIQPSREYQAGLDVSATLAEEATIRLNLYANGGEFDDETIEVDVAPTGERVPVTTGWTAPEEVDGVRFWIVATGPDNTISWLEVVPEDEANDDQSQ
jgi:hypothetical protein